MAGSAARTTTWTKTLASGALLAAVLLPVAALGQESSAAPEAPGATSSRVRAVDAKAASLLREGAARSVTFRSVVAMIETSDLIVYVETRDLRLPGQLQLVTATSSCRHVRVSVRTPGLDTELIAYLGHELWHAVELARAPEVRNQEDVLRLYQRIGEAGRYDAAAETAEAQQVWTQVLYEARTGTPSRRSTFQTASSAVR